MHKPSPTITLTVFCDGGARGNPGPAGIGFVVKDHSGQTLHQDQEFIGQATNNDAEYQAVIAALKWLVKNTKAILPPPTSVNFFLDSTLVVNQLNGNFKIKNNRLRNHFATALNFRNKLGIPTTFTAVPRSQNRQADALVNLALDKHLSP